MKLNIASDDAVARGMVLCKRTSSVPCTQIFEAEVDVLELLEQKPLFTKGYNCMMHIHTWADEITVKLIKKSTETLDNGEQIVKENP